MIETLDPPDFRLPLDPDDAELITAATQRRAAEDVELACRFLEESGVLGPQRARDKRQQTVPLSLMLKAAAFMRLRQWEKAGQVSAVGDAVPDPAALLADLHKSPKDQRFDAKAVARQVLGVWLARMGWASLVRECDVLVRDVEPGLVVDALAQLLWQCRHLAPTPTPGKEKTYERTAVE